MNNIDKLEKRNNTLDSFKGTLILLVILGHTIQWNQVDSFDENILFRIIYSFHMPAFILVSGYIYGYVKVYKSESIFFIKRNIQRLVIPFISWYLIKYFIDKIYVEINLLEYIKNLIFHVDNGLWFLWIVFLLRIIFFVIGKISNYLSLKNNFKIELLMLVILYFMINIIPFGVLGIGLLKKYYIYFFIGYIINKLYKTIKINKVVYLIVVILFIILSSQWSRVNPPLFYNEFISQKGFILKILALYIYPLITALAGTLAIYKLTKFINIKNIYISELLIYLGKNSLIIYAIHYYFISITKIRYIAISILVNFIIAIILSIILFRILKKFKFTKKILLGENIRG